MASRLPACLLVTASTALAACSLTDPVGPLGGQCEGGACDGGDASATDGRPDAEAERLLADGDRDPSVADADVDPGSMTFVVNEMTVLTDRVCDFDGDGALDNAVADLGTVAGPVFAATLDAVLAGFIAEFDGRIGIHSPWVDDRNRPHDDSTRLLSFSATPVGWDDDPADDFDGSQAFRPHSGSVDACGEPRFVLRNVRIDGGAVVGEDGSVPLPLGNGGDNERMVEGRGARIEGRIEPRGAAMAFVGCAYGAVAELGDFAPDTPVGDLSFLETMLAGGAAWGIPTVPGLTPDVDVDGDGLESFLTDDAGRITACVDGDSTTIEGRDCWQDPRIADGLSVVVDFRAAPAVFDCDAACRQHLDARDCDSTPEPSLWDPS